MENWYQIFQQVKKIEPDFANRKIQKRLMLVFDESVGILKLKNFDLEKAIACLKEGKPIIPLYVDQIHQKLIN